MFMLLICLGLFFALPVASAAGEAYITVDNAAGEAGQVIGISVTISGIEEGPGGTISLSGGQFELVYDPAAALVEDVIRGRSINQDFMFLYNREFASDKVRVVWAAQSYDQTTRDGVLCTVTFRLKTSGSFAPFMQNIVLYDQDLRPLEIAPDEEGNTLWRIVSAEEPLPAADEENSKEENAKSDPVEGPLPEEIPDGNEDHLVAALFFNPWSWLIAALVLSCLALKLIFRRRKKSKARRGRGKPK